MKKLFLFLVIISLFMSCGLTPFSEPENTTPDIPNEIIEVSLSTELFTENENCFTFETNNPVYKKNNGYTFWTTKNINTQSSFQTIETTLYKKNGNPYTGFGIVFAHQIYNNKDYLITVMINTTGNYIVGKVVDGRFEVMKDWTFCSYLNQYANNANTIKVEHIDSKFHVSLNNVEVYDFSVTESLEYKNSGSGYVAVVSNTERFPEEKVEIIYLK